MRQFNVLFIGLSIHLCTTATAQKVRPVQNIEKYTVPFQLTAYNNVVIKAVLNNRDTINLMLNTASSDVTVTEESLIKLTTLKFDGIVDSVKSWGGNTNASAFSKNNLLKIENLNWTNITIWKDINSGQQTDGKFGLNLFKNKVLELDFNKNLLTVEAKMPRNIDNYDKFQLLSRSDEIFIKAACQIGNDRFENEFLIHSGYAGDVLLDDKFAIETKIGRRINITGEKKLQDAYGNVITIKKGILPLFKIGTRQLENVPAGFFEGMIGTQKMSIIGGDILKRFNWIIDAKRTYIYLKPNNLFKATFSSS